jgi:hypothetical protein
MSAGVLVTGIHREELAFGDRVAALVDPEQVDLLRIAHGISNARTGTDGRFYSDTEHREIYLQLRQQLRQQPQWRGFPLIDLHAGVDDHGPCADIYCRPGAGTGRSRVADRFPIQNGRRALPVPGRSSITCGNGRPGAIDPIAFIEGTTGCLRLKLLTSNGSYHHSKGTAGHRLAERHGWTCR